MSDPLCPLCGTSKSGGVLYVLWAGSVGLPASDWGRGCWECHPLGDYRPPLSPITVQAWQQWVENERTHRVQASAGEAWGEEINIYCAEHAPARPAGAARA
jgi:hypothetical protein